ncbi:hypothetical protein E2C01_010346 [Portunus trituberculatus]|uniref:Secreted peptide n=1 Tax=Portunus trituberculatus TaxID=210409 RepID=A0A5B7D8D8_PORTR|nr:hypothetical protein [Portunus trituberculatus]
MVVVVVMVVAVTPAASVRMHRPLSSVVVWLSPRSGVFTLTLVWDVGWGGEATSRCSSRCCLDA